VGQANNLFHPDSDVPNSACWCLNFARSSSPWLRQALRAVRAPIRSPTPFTEIDATVDVMNRYFESKRFRVAYVRNPIANALQRDLDLILPQGTAILIAVWP
jgi:hypothetical protein